MGNSGNHVAFTETCVYTTGFCRYYTDFFCCFWRKFKFYNLKPYPNFWHILLIHNVKSLFWNSNSFCSLYMIMYKFEFIFARPYTGLCVRYTEICIYYSAFCVHYTGNCVSFNKVSYLSLLKPNQTQPMELGWW